MSVISLSDYLEDKDCPELYDHANFTVIDEEYEEEVDYTYTC